MNVSRLHSGCVCGLCPRHRKPQAILYGDVSNCALSTSRLVLMSATQAATEVFVGGLSFEATEEDVTATFSVAGDIAEVGK
jgi:hypothetical protein